MDQFLHYHVIFYGHGAQEFIFFLKAYSRQEDPLSPLLFIVVIEVMYFKKKVAVEVLNKFAVELHHHFRNPSILDLAEDFNDRDN